MKPSLTLVIASLALLCVGILATQSHLLSFASGTTCIRVNQQHFQVEVAQTAAEQRIGLQHRAQLQKAHGMLFPFKAPQVLYFWMKDCDIPLDILFFRDGRVVKLVHSAPPCHEADAERCPIYSSDIMADTALELPAGSIERYGLKADSRLLPCQSVHTGAR